MKRRISLLVVLTLVFTLTCGSITTVNAASKATIKMSKTSVAVVVKKTTKLTAKVSGKIVKNSGKWTTSKKSVATVSKKGVVTAKKKGIATITYSVKDKKTKKTVKATCKVFVGKKATEYNFNLDEESVRDALENNKYVIYEEDVHFTGSDAFAMTELSKSFFKKIVYIESAGLTNLGNPMFASGAKVIFDNDIKGTEYDPVPRTLGLDSAECVEDGSCALLTFDPEATLTLNGVEYTKADITGYMDADTGEALDNLDKIDGLLVAQAWNGGEKSVKVLGLRMGA